MQGSCGDPFLAEVDSPSGRKVVGRFRGYCPPPCRRACLARAIRIAAGLLCLALPVPACTGQGTFGKTCQRVQPGNPFAGYERFDG